MSPRIGKVDWLEHPGQTSVERAIAELRSGRPVVIAGDGAACLALPAESLDAAGAEALACAARLGDGAAGDVPAGDTPALSNGRLVLSAARLRRIGIERSQPGVVALPAIDPARVEALALRVDGRIDAPVGPASALDLAALELARLALLLPAMVVVPMSGKGLPAALMAVAAADIGAYRATHAATLRLVSRAPVPLEGAPDSEFVIFRGGEGMRDQVAIVVGKPDVSAPVIVRLHSACLTGDLFGSLKCDCGDQLRSTVRVMSENGGGVLLYLDQEGRGNGLANKIRAYRLQSQGWDTYDADEVLGFGLDQRGFDFAAEMLKQLGVRAVTLMTNNPQKIAALQRAGIEVAEAHRVLGRATAENVLYLASKRDRAGHFIDLDDLVARKPAQD